MKLKKTSPKLIIIISTLLILIIAAIFLFSSNKTGFLQPSQNQTSQDQKSQEPLLPDKDYGTRDPNLSNEKNLIKDYVSAHLSTLSPTKEVLGGKFYLTDIKFLDNNQAQISYEDGHIALQAEFHYEINPQELKITDFKISKEN
jgi:hypothetical protein